MTSLLSPSDQMRITASSLLYSDLDVPPDQFIFQLGQKNGQQGDLAQDSQSTSEVCSLWLMNEIRTLVADDMPYLNLDFLVLS